MVLKSTYGTPLNFVDWRRESRSFESMAAIDTTRFNLTGGEQPQALQGARVSASFFRVMGVEPARGRGFRPEEDRPGAERVAVISHGLWQSRFGSDPAVVGRPIQLDGQSLISIVVHKSHAHLQFFNGAELAVQYTALEGTGKGMRHLKCRYRQPVDAELVRDLVVASVEAAS